MPLQRKFATPSFLHFMAFFHGCNTICYNQENLKKILASQAEQEDVENKYNRMGILAKTSHKKKLINLSHVRVL